MTPAEVAAARASGDPVQHERVRQWVRSTPWWARRLPGAFLLYLRSYRYDPERFPLRWLLRQLVFSAVRWTVVRGIDPNEDFNCCFCSKPLLRRDMYCSMWCEIQQEWEWAWQAEQGE